MQAPVIIWPDKEKQALTDLSFTANVGETVALVGRSGSGKSTASALLLRFYTATTGRVLIDGKETVFEVALKGFLGQYISRYVETTS